MAKGVKRKVQKALEAVEEEMADSSHDSFYGRGLASEGYNGGYRDCLHDIQLALEGITPSRRGWWKDD